MTSLGIHHPDTDVSLSGYNRCFSVSNQQAASWGCSSRFPVSGIPKLCTPYMPFFILLDTTSTMLGCRNEWLRLWRWLP